MERSALNILETINKSAFKLLASDSLSKLSKTIVEEARKLVGADHGSIFLFDKNKNRLERTYTSLLFLKKVRIRKTGNTDYTFRTGKINIVPKNALDKSHPELRSQGLKSTIMLPLSYKKEVIGVLSIDSVHEEYFTKKQLDILKLYASLACLAIMRTKLYDETKRALEVRDRFISLASHELRTPLTSINGYIQLLYSKLANKDTIESRWMEELYTESNRLTSLVKDLLDVNRIKQGQFAFSLTEVDMKDVVEKVIKQYRMYNPEREIVFEDKVDDSQYRVIGDFDKLREMVSALLSNAVKFSKPHAKIIITLIPTARSLHMKMKDYGRGIPKQDINNIFEGFYKTKYSKEKEGMGVGLLLAQHVVNFHRGKISISSKEQKGTTVDVELPRIKI